MPEDQLEKPCTYEISRFGSEVPCTCSPDSAGKACRCHGESNPWLRKEPADSGVDHGPQLVGYVRLDDELLGEDEQMDILNNFCVQKNFRIVQTFVDKGKPSYALQEALQLMESHDGLIAVNLQSFVVDTKDRLRDLRPFVHHFFCTGNKHLVTVQEHIDTATSEGQIAAEDAISYGHETFDT